MKSTDRIDDPGVEYKCTNCGGFWLYVENPEPEIINMKHGILIENSVFFPVYYPRVLADILEQRPNKSQAKRIRQWVKSKRLASVKKRKKKSKLGKNDSEDTVSNN